MAATRIHNKQEKFKRDKAKELSQSMLRNERVAARLTKHTFAKNRRSLPNRKNMMQKLDNLIYIVNQNELDYNAYLG